MTKRPKSTIVAPVLLAVALLVGILVTGELPPLPKNPVFSESLSVGLPEDVKLARKELQKSRKALARLRPSGPYIVIDTHANTVSLRTHDSILFKATCSTGSGGRLTDPATGSRWTFNTPRGVFKIKSKLQAPWWRKPDWAFIEEKERIPEKESERLDPEMLGEYAMAFGNGYFIHGTIYERLLGVSVTHGCVRLGGEDLKWLYHRVKIGTPVYVF